jgi:uracil-DNA glycosylase
MFFEAMDRSWQVLLGSHRQLLADIEGQLIDTSGITPALDQVMRAFELPVEKVRVLILGQDPYPAQGMACGLAFAHSPGTPVPQSLRNLMKELKTDLPVVSNSGDIVRWVSQGVLLLNSALTTQVGTSGKHQETWREFIEAVITELDRSRAGKLTCLSLGTKANNLSQLIEQGSVVSAVHPSPLSAHRGFFGSKIYSRVNKILCDQGQDPIDWSC